MSIRIRIQFVGALGMALLAACSGGRILKVTETPAPTVYSAPKGEAWLRADTLWNARQIPDQAYAALKAYRHAARKQQNVPELLTRWSRACHLVATYVEKNPNRQEALYREGAEAAEQALDRHAGFAKVLEETGDEVEAVGAVDGAFVEPAFWYAANLGRLVNLEGAKVRIGNRERLETFIQRVLAKNEALYFGGGHRFLGVMYLVLPRPNPDSARIQFGQALKMSPLFFGTRTMMAEYLAVKEKNAAGFREQLEFVIKTPPDTLPEAAAENFYEQERAKELLAAEADLF